VSGEEKLPQSNPTQLSCYRHPGGKGEELAMKKTKSVVVEEVIVVVGE
jgi:hypothetical protein